MFSEKLTPQGSGETSRLPRTTSHRRLDGRRIFNNDCNLRVVSAELRAIIQVCRAADDNTIISNQNLQ
jgi:hypothetical protein